MPKLKSLLPLMAIPLAYILGSFVFMDWLWFYSVTPAGRLMVSFGAVMSAWFIWMDVSR